jgi:hypothetical protein
MGKTIVMAFLVLLLALGTSFAEPAEGDPAAEAAASEPPPLPLHSFEGTGGSFIVHSAYLVNPPAEGQVAGLPAFGGIHVHIGHGRSLYSLTVTETLFGRVELGYGLNHFHAGDLPQDIQNATGFVIRDDTVDMHNFNARVLILGEGSFDQSWVPAVTAGAHFKYNETVEHLDNDLAGTLTAIGIEDDQGWDFTLYASKMITALPRLMIVTTGLRSTEGAQAGLLGFTGEREIVAEASVCVLATGRLILAAEYRQKPNEYTKIPGLVGREDDWWTICAAYIVNNRLTIAGGYANFGDLLNHEAQSAWGIAVKVEM